ncbi:MAG: hypothetical protein AAB425_02840 [Bdellovibrionota bacterium]
MGVPAEEEVLSLQLGSVALAVRAQKSEEAVDILRRLYAGHSAYRNELNARLYEADQQSFEWVRYLAHNLARGPGI